MLRDHKLYLEDIATAIQNIEDYVKGYSCESFLVDNKTVDAVIRNFEIIGEAARNIPAEIKQQHPQIEWKKIYLFRNVLAHEYFGVNKKMVWDMIQNHLGDLKRDVTGLLDTTS